jgi:hypothetical protein
MLPAMLRRVVCRALLTGLVVLGVPLASGGCTLQVLEDAAAPPACTSADDCPAGFRCTDGACAATAADPLPPEAVLVGSEGGSVIGVDGVTLTLDAGALASPTAFTITATTATLEYEGFQPTSRFYVVEPALSVAGARMRVRIPGTAEGATLFLRPSSPGPAWAAIPANGDAFPLERTGTFAVGVAEEP